MADLLTMWEQTIASSLQTNLLGPIPTTDTDPLVMAASTATAPGQQSLLDSVGNNLAGVPAINSSTPTQSDPLVVAASTSTPGQESLLTSVGDNLAAYPMLDSSTPTTSDPLIVASFQPMIGQDSPQMQLANRPFGYDDTHHYDQQTTSKGLYFTDTNVPPNVIPDQGNLGGQFEGGNLYNPVDDSPLATFAPIASRMPGTMLNSGDVFALAQYARNIAMGFGIIPRPGETKAERMQSIAKGAAFLATQVLLSTFNPADPQNGGLLNLLYNPTSFPASFIPGLQGNALSSPNIPAVLSVDGKAYSTTQGTLPSAADRHLLMRQGAYAKVTNASDIANGTLINYPGFIGNLEKPGEGDALGAKKIPGVDGVPISAQVDQDGVFGRAAQTGPYMVNLYDYQNTYSDGPAIDNDYIEQKMLADQTAKAPDIIRNALFKPDLNTPSTPAGLVSALGNSLLSTTKTTQYRWFFERNIASSVLSPYRKSKPSSYPSDYDMAFSTENSDGTIDEANVISDNDNYMPFTFQDLRETTPKLLYFRAFLRDGTAENFLPSWQSENYYGRVDEVPTYVNTVRTLQLAFDVVAWHPKDLPIMWTKLTKLQSMVYPTFDTNNYLQAGPLIRMRVGDLFTSHMSNNVKKGLPGYLSSLNFAYDDNIWNVTTDYKIPRKVNVSLTFVVVHDGNPGVYIDSSGKGVFGTLEFAQQSTSNSQSTLEAAASSFVTGETTAPTNASTTTGTPLPGGIRGIVDTINGPKSDLAAVLNNASSVLT